MTKEQYLQEIANTLIEITHEFHNLESDIVSELVANKTAVDLLIGKEALRIRIEEGAKECLD